MARLGRYFLPDQPLHVIQRGNNRGAIFFAADDYAGYRDWVAAAAAANGCAIHACVRKTNHAPAGDAARRGARAPGRPTAEGPAAKAQGGSAAIKSTLTPYGPH